MNHVASRNFVDSFGNACASLGVRSSDLRVVATLAIVARRKIVNVRDFEVINLILKQDASRIYAVQ